MEIILWGPGGTIATWALNETQYNYWKDKSRKFIFDYSWNLPDMREGNHFDEEHPPRDKLGGPDNAWFFQPRDQIWRGDKRPNKLNNVLDICEYDKAIIYYCNDNEITKHYPDEIPNIRYGKKFKPISELFYSAISTEVGNWEHKWYSTNVPLDKFRIHTVFINGKKWIMNLTTSMHSNWNMYEEVHLDWSYRLHVRNQSFVEDMSTFTNIDFHYDLNTGNHEQDCSHFAVHDTRFR